MNIGVIMPHLKAYGGVRRFLELGKQLIKYGHSYTLYVVDTSQEYPWLKELGYTGQWKPIKMLFMDNPDICLCGDVPSLPMLREVKSKHKIVCVIFPPFSSYALGNYGDFLKNPAYTVVGNSTGWAGPLNKESWWFTIPGAVDTTLFQNVPVLRDNTTFKILFMAKNRPWKGMDTIKETYNILKALKTNVEWGYFDTEPHSEYPFSEMKAHIGIPQRDMSGLYSSYHCFVSVEELAGWQNTVAEAMACRTPVITTAIGTRDFAINNRTALVIPEKNPTELVKAINMYRLSEPLRRTLSKMGLDQIKKFSWEKYGESWHQFLFDHCSEKQSSISIEEIERKTKEIEKLSKNTDLQSLSLNSEREAIARKAATLSAAAQGNIVIKPLNDTTKPFDKYEKLGSYHWNSQDPVYKEYVNILSRFFAGVMTLKGKETILDVGGGDGYIAAVLNKLGFDVELIDTNETALRFAQENCAESGIKIKISNQDVFKLTSLPKCVLLSQVIEHFYHPEELVKLFKIHQPRLIVVTTPLKKSDGTWWDEKYHVKEYSKDDLLNLFSPLQNDYIFMYACQGTFNQFLILENRKDVLMDYLKSINIHVTTEVTMDGHTLEGLVSTNNQVILEQLTEGILMVTDQSLKQGDFI